MKPPFTPDGDPIKPAKVKVTAKQIVSALYRYQSNHPITLHEKMAFLNSYVTADFVTVTRAGQLYEFEVKVTRSDYLREVKKRRHEIYHGKHCGGGFFKKPAHKNRFGTEIAERNVDMSRRDVPNRFWIVCPEGVVKDKDDLLDYAGLLIFDPEKPEGSRLTVRHRAPKLRKESFAWADIAPLASAMKFRRALTPEFRQ